MDFDMNAAWERAVELIKDNLQLLAIVSAVFLLLPSIAIYLFMPNMIELSDPGADPDVVMAQLQENLGPLITAGLVGMVVQFAGYGAMIALMSGARPTVGEAIVTGFKITPTIIIQPTIKINSIPTIRQTHAIRRSIKLLCIRRINSK